MKIAICISGQPRCALESFPYIKSNLIDPNNADVFIHMHYYENNLYMEKSHFDNGNCILEKGIDKKIIELYQPKEYLIESPRNFQKPNIIIDEKRLERSKKMNSNKLWDDIEHSRHTIKQVTSMYYSIYKCNCIKELYANENGIVYDYVIRVRFDLIIKNEDKINYSIDHSKKYKTYFLYESKCNENSLKEKLLFIDYMHFLYLQILINFYIKLKYNKKLLS